MGTPEDSEHEAVLSLINLQVDLGEYRVTQHAQAEMVEEEYVLDDVLHAIGNAHVIENYPEHRRGACCLLNGMTRDGRPVHIVCTTRNPVVIIITVYEPKEPKWKTPTERSR